MFPFIMSVLIFLITIISLAFIVWVVRKIMDLIRFRRSAEESSPSEELPGGSLPPSRANNNNEYSNAKNPDGRRVLNAMLFMAQQYSSRPTSAANGGGGRSMRRASLRNGTVRVRNSSSPHRVAPTRVAYRSRANGSNTTSRPPLLPMGENTVQIEVPIVVVLPPISSGSNVPTTMLYDDPPPPFDEEPPPPYEEIFGSK